MSCILYVDDEESNRKLNIDDLYEKRQRRELKQLTIFNKILNRIHKRITTTARTKVNDKHIFFIVPEYIFGEPLYDKGDCLGYLVTKLEENGFNTRFIYPNTLFISWNNWIPSYVRTEFKKKTGMVIDEKGNVISKREELVDENDINANLFNDKTNPQSSSNQKEQKQYTPIDQYKPTGNLIYNKDMFDKIEKKISFRPPNNENGGNQR
jgi:hypothetical protein